MAPIALVTVNKGLSLNNGTLDFLPSTVEPLKYDRTKRAPLRGGIVHFGVGAFHRSHQALYLDEVLARTGSTEWGLVGVGLLPYDLPMRDAMREQDCLYTVTEKCHMGKSKTKVVQCMIEYVYGPDDFGAVVNRLMDPDVKIVSLTITEGGYLMDTSGKFVRDHPTVVKDLANPSAPQSAFGIIIEALNRRRNAGMDAFTVMSCDNLRHNGDQAKKACLGFANVRDTELAKWIEANVTFPNGMVDRITPAMNAEVRQSINDRSGVNDSAPVIAENFRQWVLEDNFKYGRPEFEIAGVTVTDCVTPYEEAKIRLLNGSHQMLSYPAFLSGHRKVDSALSDKLFRDYIRDFLDKDAAVWLQSIPGMDLEEYKQILLDRFGNPAIGDQIARLCLDGGSKIPGFLLPTIEANCRATGTCHRLAYLLACYNHYIREKRDDAGESFELKEPNAMALLEPIIASNDPMTLLECTQLVGDAAVRYPRFVRDYLTCCERVREDGARKTLENLSAVLGHSRME